MLYCICRSCNLILDPMNEEYFTAGLGAADDEVDIAMCEMDAEMADNNNNI